MKIQIVFALLISLSSTSHSSITVKVFPEPVLLRGCTEQGYADFHIDLNDDGQYELFFEHVALFEPNHVDVYTVSGSGCELLAESSNEVIALSACTPVSDLLNSWKSNTSGIFTVALKLDRHFRGSGRKYIGIRFNIDDEFHYGWVEICIPDDLSQILICGYAFNTVPNQMICAGQVEPSVFIYWLVRHGVLPSSCHLDR